MGASSLTLSDVSVLSSPPPNPPVASAAIGTAFARREQAVSQGTTQGGGEGDGDALPKLEDAHSLRPVRTEPLRPAPIY